MWANNPVKRAELHECRLRLGDTAEWESAAFVQPLLILDTALHSAQVGDAWPLKHKITVVFPHSAIALPPLGWRMAAPKKQPDGGWQHPKNSRDGRWEPSFTWNYEKKSGHNHDTWPLKHKITGVFPRSARIWDGGWQHPKSSRMADGSTQQTPGMADGSLHLRGITREKKMGTTTTQRSPKTLQLTSLQYSL